MPFDFRTLAFFAKVTLLRQGAVTLCFLSDLEPIRVTLCVSEKDKKIRVLNITYNEYDFKIMKKFAIYIINF